MKELFFSGKTQELKKILEKQKVMTAFAGVCNMRE